MKREAAKTFEDLVVWQKAHTFVLQVYRYSQGFPKREIYGLTTQLRRAAISIPANIAEDFKRRSKADKARFMNIAQGSLQETRYYLILATNLTYLPGEDLLIQLEEVSRLLEGYRRGILPPASCLLPPDS